MIIHCVEQQRCLDLLHVFGLSLTLVVYVDHRVDDTRWQFSMEWMMDRSLVGIVTGILELQDFP